MLLQGNLSQTILQIPCGEICRLSFPINLDTMNLQVFGRLGLIRNQQNHTGSGVLICILWSNPLSEAIVEHLKLFGIQIPKVKSEDLHQGGPNKPSLELG